MIRLTQKFVLDHKMPRNMYSYSVVLSYTIGKSMEMGFQKAEPNLGKNGVQLWDSAPSHEKNLFLLQNVFKKLCTGAEVLSTCFLFFFGKTCPFLPITYTALIM